MGERTMLASTFVAWIRGGRATVPAVGVAALALSSRSVDMGNCSINDLIQSVEIGGAPLALLMTESVTALNYAAIAKPEHRSWSDLRGKTAMVDSPRGNTVYFWRTMARANGLADEEYDFQYAGTTNARYAALKAGAMDAV